MLIQSISYDFNKYQSEYLVGLENSYGFCYRLNTLVFTLDYFCLNAVDRKFAVFYKKSLFQHKVFLEIMFGVLSIGFRSTFLVVFPIQI